VLREMLPLKLLTRVAVAPQPFASSFRCSWRGQPIQWRTVPRHGCATAMSASKNTTSGEHGLTKRIPRSLFGAPQTVIQFLNPLHSGAHRESRSRISSRITG